MITKLYNQCVGSVVAVVAAGLVAMTGASGQDAVEAVADGVSATSSVDGEVIIEARGLRPKKLPAMTSLHAVVHAKVGMDSITNVVSLRWDVLQGEPEVLSVRLSGTPDVTSVGGNVKSWSRRVVDGVVVVDVIPAVMPKAGAGFDATLHLLTEWDGAPGVRLVPSAGAAENVAFSQQLTVVGADGVFPTLHQVSGFWPLKSDLGDHAFVSQGDGVVLVHPQVGGVGVQQAGEWRNVRVHGGVEDSSDSAGFRFEGMLSVAGNDDASVVVPLLGGGGAPRSVTVNGQPANVVVVRGADALATWGGDHYAVEIDGSTGGEVNVAMMFSAKVARTGGRNEVLFKVPSAGVVPMTMDTVRPAKFFTDAPGLVGMRDVNIRTRSPGLVSGNEMSGFLPASGVAKFAWTELTSADEGELFFTVRGDVRMRVDAGMVQQQTSLVYKLLQGEISTLVVDLDGPGEVVDVNGPGVTGWKVDEKNGSRRLVATLAGAHGKSEQTVLSVYSRSPVGEFPAVLTPMRLLPDGAVRYSGSVQVESRGAVRADVVDPRGLVQVAAADAGGDVRQRFAYQFPSEDFGFDVRVTQVVPELSVNSVMVFRMGESDQSIQLDLELDVRDAPLRELVLDVPDGYSVASVTGAEVADYVLAGSEEDGRRRLKVLFSNPLMGRHMVMAQLERGKEAAAGDWSLDRVDVVGAKNVRGFIGVVAADGFRIAGVRSVKGMVESPLTFFPKRDAGVQLAFRMREAAWSSVVVVEALGQSVEADVFHLYSLKEGMAYGSVLINYFVVGAPVSQWKIAVPESLGNLLVDGENVRGWRRDGDVIVVDLNKSTSGSSILLLTFEKPMQSDDNGLSPGVVHLLDVQSESGYIQVVSPYQVRTQIVDSSSGLLPLDTSELPAEYQLLTPTPTLAAFQYASRPFNLELGFEWFSPGETVGQVVDFANVVSKVARDGQVMTEATYFVKTRGRRPLPLTIPEGVKLWGVEVNGESVTAQTDGTATMIPLPPNPDPNDPVRVRVRIGQTAPNGSKSTLVLPSVGAPVMIADWVVRADDGRMVLPAGGDVDPPNDPRRAIGADVLRNGAFPLALLLVGGVCSVGFALALARRLSLMTVGLGVVGVIVAVVAAIVASESGGVNRASLVYSLPAVTSGEMVEIVVRNVPSWRAMLSPVPVLLALAGGVCLVAGMIRKQLVIRGAGWLLGALACLLQPGGAPLFFAVVGAFCVFELIVLRLAAFVRDRKLRREKVEAARAAAAGATTAVLVLLGSWMLASPVNAQPAAQQEVNANESVQPIAHVSMPGVKVPNSIKQSWTLTDDRITASVRIRVDGNVGDVWHLLSAPALLTSFDVPGFKVRPVTLSNGRTVQVMERKVGDGPVSGAFTYELALPGATVAELAIPTSPAAIDILTTVNDSLRRDVSSSRSVAVRRGSDGVEHTLGMRGNHTVTLAPMKRDTASEETEFFVDAQHLFVPSPGVIDGWHQVGVRPSRGEVSSLTMDVPIGFTVSDVTGGNISTWRFDPEARELSVDLLAPSSDPLRLMVRTQRAVTGLPGKFDLDVLKVRDARNAVRLVGLAFGPQAQLDSVVKSDGFGRMSLEDFDARLVAASGAALRRVFRDSGERANPLVITVAPVEPEIRMTSSQVLSLGDERVVLGATLMVDIARSGVFSLSLPVPDGMEVESLTGDGVAHWAEGDAGDGARVVTLHLNQRTKGQLRLDVSFVGVGIKPVEQWTVPRVQLTEAVRSSGRMVVVPDQGLRVRAVTRSKVSQGDARDFGESRKGALAFRLLEKDWSLDLAVEALDPWITARVLQEITFREGQTRTRLGIGLQVENAGVKKVRISLPEMSSETERTLRASDGPVADLVKMPAVEGELPVWEVRFQRRVIGGVNLVLEYQEIGAPVDGTGESVVTPVSIVDARQQNRFVVMRSGGRLALAVKDLNNHWQKAPWGAVPDQLKDNSDLSSPTESLRLVRSDSSAPLNVVVTRRQIAEALKLQVVKTNLTTVVSAAGESVTIAQIRVQVVEKNTLRAVLPDGFHLMNAFVNEESVMVAERAIAGEGVEYLIPVTDDSDDEGMATVRFAYSGDVEVDGSDFGLIGPRMSVPLRDIEWQVALPAGYQLGGHSDMYSKIGGEWSGEYGVEDYLGLISSRKQASAQKAEDMLDLANDYIQQGEQEKARRALSKVAHGNALDAASNEDARVQLKTLQTQQAVFSLNTRRQKLKLYNTKPTNEEVDTMNRNNPLLLGGKNYSQQQAEDILADNTVEENKVLRRLAERIIDQQQAAAPAPEGIELTIPTDGETVGFTRAMQVDGGAAMRLDLELERSSGKPVGLTVWGVLIAMLMVAAGVATGKGKAA